MVIGTALLGGSFVLEIDGMREAGIGLVTLGAIVCWGSARARR
jgi:hypothetical protein